MTCQITVHEPKDLVREATLGELELLNSIK